MLFRKLLPLVILLCLIPLALNAETLEESIARLDALIESAEGPDDVILMGDSGFTVKALEGFRNQLKLKAGQKIPKTATTTTTTKWTDGVVYYKFDDSVSDVRMQNAFKDACAEWAMFANLTFTELTGSATTAYYMNVRVNNSLGGGQSHVGMVGPAQLFDIGPSSWNRHTLCHEIGHTLGLIHEHQRSDRDTYVTIAASLEADGNFAVIGNSDHLTEDEDYDFLSVMHYERNTFDTTNAIVPKPGYEAFSDQMGRQFDRCLSKTDREAIAEMYGAPTTPVGSIVTNTKDSGAGSLRGAMYYSFDHPGTTITFNIPNAPNDSPRDIVLSNTMTRPGPNTIVDGTSQPQYSSDIHPDIQITGTPGVGYVDYGLTLREHNITVKGIIFNGFPEAGIRVNGVGATGNVISACYMGTSMEGSIPSTVQKYGVVIDGGASNNTIGGTTAAARNVISGNTHIGVLLTDAGTTNNRVQGNYIGLESNGAGTVPNGLNTEGLVQAGVAVLDGADGNFVGTDEASGGNIISGNNGNAIYLNDVENVVIARNYVGLNSAGNQEVANDETAIYTPDCSGLIVARNVISGNFYIGMDLRNSTNCVIKGNIIGMDPLGEDAMPNGDTGLYVSGGSGHLIGGYTAADRNVISGNNYYGLALTGGVSNVTVVGNYIGLNAAGTQAYANAQTSLPIYFAGSGIRIGSPLPGGRNVISGYTGGQGRAITLTDGANGAIIQGNYIGTDATGMNAIPNGGGILIYNTGQHQIGGYLPGEGNVISGNQYEAIYIDGTGTQNMVIAGNIIGRNALNSASLQNGSNQILAWSLTNSTIAQNVIQFIGGYPGIGLQTEATVQGNTISRNSLFGSSGTSPIGGSNFANGPQPVPTLTASPAYNAVDGTLEVGYSLASTTNGVSYTLEFFGTPSADGAGGRYFLGSLTSSGNGGTLSGTHKLTVGVLSGYRILATATNAVTRNTSRYSAAVTVSFTDSDSNLLPDAYETAKNLNTALVGDNEALLDPDGDGQSNLDEFYAGTNPNSGADRLRLSAIWNPAEGLSELTIPSVNGVGYNIERTLALGGTWTPLIYNVPGTGGNVIIDDPGSSSLPNAYYRLSVVR